MRPGITEVVWNKEFGEHQRLMWTGFIGVVSAVAAYFVPKTAIQELNVLLSVYLVVNGVFIVHVQRKFGSFRAADGVRFSRYSVRFFIAGLVLLNLGAWPASACKRSATSVFSSTGRWKTADIHHLATSFCRLRI